MKKRKRNGLLRALLAVLGFVCALVLGAVFYGTMVYQLGGEETIRTQAVLTIPAQTTAQTTFPGALLSVPGEMQAETVREETWGGEICCVVERTYLMDGVQVTAVSAAPAAYLARLAEEGFSPQLMTGFSLAGLDAICEKQGERSVLVAREGDCVYLLMAQTDDQTLYALGAAATLETAE